MHEPGQEVFPVNIEDELQQSYLDYAMSVIIGRALPDVRDGLKPVHRRVLFAMNELNNHWNKPYKKSARIVGDVIGKYHPHGESAVYDTLVRMAQPFTMRTLLVDGQGNFGSVDGDSAAAMRYTEARLSKFAQVLLDDLDKDTVDFSPNYDASEYAPDVLPARIPHLLINGATGIAVGMATNIPTHNVAEVIDATVAFIQNDAITLPELMAYLPGPDFPTGAIINGRAGIVDAYRTGRGRVVVRSRANIEFDEKTGKQTIIVTEIPYQVNKARLIEKIAELVKDKKLEGITALRDESDKDGMRIVVELRRGESAEVMLNNLYNQTQMQSVFSVNMVALTQGQPRLMNLTDILAAFVRHRQVVVNRRTVFELKKARERAHILEGLGVALANIDTIITMIKTSKSPQEANARLQAVDWEPGVVRAMLDRAGVISRPVGLDAALGLQDAGYRLSSEQSQAILDLRLHRLTALEQGKILEEYEALLESVRALLEILENPERLKAVIVEELQLIRKEFQDGRRSEILDSQQDLTNEDLIPPEDRVVTFSHAGYVKTQPVDTYQSQHRGGRGKTATAVKDEDFIEQLLVANTHDTILCFSSKGKVYWLKVHQLPQGSRTSRGRPIVNLLPLDTGEKISAILPLQLNIDLDTKYVFMATAQGTVKKVSLSEFSRPRSSGLIALDLDFEDTLVGAQLTDGESAVMLFSNAGKAVRFHESTVRCMGRTARGVRGIQLQENQRVISLIVADPACQLLIATENGFGKRTRLAEFPERGRGGQGVISIQTTVRNGEVIGALLVTDFDDVLLMTNGGTLVRIPVQEVSVVSRNTQGVKLIQLQANEKLISIQRVDEIPLGAGVATINGSLAIDGEVILQPEVQQHDQDDHNDAGAEDVE